MSTSKRGGFKTSKHFSKKRASPEDDGEDSAPRTAKRNKAEDDGTPLVPTLEEDDNHDAFVALNKSGTRRVTIQEFKGNTLIAIREYYTDAAGELKPGKKGISLSLEQYNALLGAAPLLEGVLAKKDLQVVRPEYDGDAPVVGAEKDGEVDGHEEDQESDE